MNEPDDSGIDYDVEAFELFKMQTVRPSAEEIALVADRLWADPVLGEAFRRVKLDGDLTEEEDAAATAFIKAQQTGDLWNRRFDDLWLATGLVRRRAAGVLDDFRGEEARAFVADRVLNSTDGSYGHVGVDTPAGEVFALIRAMLDDAEMVALFRRREEGRDSSPEDTERVLQFIHSYRRKHCLGNRADLVGARPASMIARGEATGLDDPKVIHDLKFHRRIIWPKGARP